MKVLILAYTDLEKDPRPYRQIKSIYKEHEVHCIGAKKSGLEKYFYQILKHGFFTNIFRLFLLKIGFDNWYYWDKYKIKLIKQLFHEEFDLIIVHEIRLVPLGIKLAKNSPVILDAHEYSPKNFSDDLLWRFFIKDYYTKLCNEYIPKVDKLITVSKGIFEEYSKNFNINPILITNKSEYISSLKPKKINPSKIKLLHHGNLSSSRKINLLIEMMRHLDNERYELSLILLYGTYEKFIYNRLKRSAKGLNIKFLNPVKRKNLIGFSNNFDIGISFFPPTNFNLKYALPNKFFEFIQSRLAVVVGPDIEMSNYVKKYDIGVISKGWSAYSLASIIKSIKYSKLKYYKFQAHRYAKKLSSFENDIVFKEIVNSYKT